MVLQLDYHLSNLIINKLKNLESETKSSSPGHYADPRKNGSGIERNSSFIPPVGKECHSLFSKHWGTEYPAWSVRKQVLASGSRTMRRAGWLNRPSVEWPRSSNKSIGIAKHWQSEQRTRRSRSTVIIRGIPSRKPCSPNINISYESQTISVQAGRQVHRHRRKA